MTQTAAQYAADVRARVERFVRELGLDTAGRVRAVELDGADRATAVVVRIVRSGAVTELRWPIWDASNPFDEPWCPPHEVSSDIVVEPDESVRNP